MIKRARKKYNFTQKQLAIRCNLSQGYLSKLENFKQGDSLPTLKHVIILSKELNLDPHKLASWFIDKELRKDKVEFSLELCIGGALIESSNIFKKI